MRLSGLVSFNRLLWMVNNPLRMIGPMTNGIQNFVASYERVSELLGEDSDLKEAKSPLNPETLEGYIKFENVGFKY